MVSEPGYLPAITPACCQSAHSWHSACQSIARLLHQSANRVACSVCVTPLPACAHSFVCFILVLKFCRGNLTLSFNHALHSSSVVYAACCIGDRWCSPPEYCNLELRVYILLRLKFWRVLPEVIVNNAIRIVDNGTDSPNNATRIAIDPTKIPVGCRSFAVNMFLWKLGHELCSKMNIGVHNE